MLNSLDVLIVSERPDHLHRLIRILNSSSAKLSASFTIRQARLVCSRQPVDLIFCDEQLSDGSYRDLLCTIRFGQSAPGFVLLLHTGEWEEYLDAMRLGALDVLRCPLKPPEVEATLLRAVAHKEKRIVARLASKIPQGMADEISPENTLFEELLARAAATVSSSTDLLPGAPDSLEPKRDDCRPTSVRKDVA